MPDVRIIVLNFKRPHNVFKIISAYKNIFPITVINNNPDKPFPYIGQPIDVINNDKITIVWKDGGVMSTKSLLNLSLMMIF